MDWFTLLLIFIFFVLPLIQQVLGQRKGPGPGDLPDEEFGGVATEPEPRPRTTRRAPPREEEEENWSSGWGEWPGAATQSAEEEVEEEWAPRVEEPEYLPARTPPPEPVLPTPVPVDIPAPVSLERLVIDRDAEHARMRQRFATDLAPTPMRRRTRAQSLIDGRDELRRAVLLSEVLGKPRALRPPGFD